jgi:hypothetical protein
MVYEQLASGSTIAVIETRTLALESLRRELSPRTGPRISWSCFRRCKKGGVHQVALAAFPGLDSGDTLERVVDFPPKSRNILNVSLRSSSSRRIAFDSRSMLVTCSERAGSGCLNRFSAPISGAAAGLGCRHSPLRQITFTVGRSSPSIAHNPRAMRVVEHQRFLEGVQQLRRQGTVAASVADHGDTVPLLRDIALALMDVSLHHLKLKR